MGSVSKKKAYGKMRIHGRNHQNESGQADQMNKDRHKECIWKEIDGHCRLRRKLLEINTSANYPPLIPTRASILGIIGGR
jgi:hypothetical protein